MAAWTTLEAALDVPEHCAITVISRAELDKLAFARPGVGRKRTHYSHAYYLRKVKPRA